jgi:ketosteroid isomerase-like protein
MRNVTVAVVLLVAGTAGAQGTKAKDAAASAKALVDKMDAAFNAKDLKSIEAALDKGFFGEGPTVSSTFADPAAFTKHLEQMFAGPGGRMTREAMTLKTDDDGGAAWYIADYTFIPKVPPGAMPVHRKMRESGVLVKRGKEWKVAMWHMSMVQPDPPPPAGAAAPAAAPPH